MVKFRHESFGVYAPSSSMVSFCPPTRLLMGAGPATLSPRVVKAMTRPVISHLDPLFTKLFEEVRELLHYVMRTDSVLTFPVQGAGSTAMEMCFANLVETGDHVVVMDNGVYGARMQHMAALYGARVTPLQQAWGQEASVCALEEVLASHQHSSPVKLVCFVHGESSTGVMSDAKELSRIAHHYGALVLCDVAATLGGVPVLVDEWELDACYANPQKCLSAPSGLAPISFSDRAFYAIQHRKTLVKNWCLTLSSMHHLWTSSPRVRSYPYTSPMLNFYALHEALLMIAEEGIDTVWERHRHNAQVLSHGLSALGFVHYAKDVPLIPVVNVVRHHSFLDLKALRAFLSEHFQLEISAGMGHLEHDTVRIGAMGQTCTAENIVFCLSSLGQALRHFGIHVNLKEILQNAQKMAFHDAQHPFLHNLDALYKVA